MDACISYIYQTQLSPSQPGSSKYCKSGIDHTWSAEFPWLEVEVVPNQAPGMWCTFCHKNKCRPTCKRIPIGMAGGCVHFFAKQGIAHTTKFSPLIDLSKSLDVCRKLRNVLITLGQTTYRNIVQDFLSSPALAVSTDESIVIFLKGKMEFNVKLGKKITGTTHARMWKLVCMRGGLTNRVAARGTQAASIFTEFSCYCCCTHVKLVSCPDPTHQ